MTRSHLVWLATFLAVAVGFSLTMSACGVAALDLNGHPCPCGAGFTCDTTRNLCVTPDQIVVEAGVDPCLGDSCTCVTKEDCKDRTYPTCVDAKCVQCSSTGPDTCPPLSYCLANQCATGCKTDDECASLAVAAPFCNTDRHQCVVCKTDAAVHGRSQVQPCRRMRRRVHGDMRQRQSVLQRALPRHDVRPPELQRMWRGLRGHFARLLCGSLRRPAHQHDQLRQVWLELQHGERQAVVPGRLVQVDLRSGLQPLHDDGQHQHRLRDQHLEQCLQVR